MPKLESGAGNGLASPIAASPAARKSGSLQRYLANKTNISAAKSLTGRPGRPQQSAGLPGCSLPERRARRAPRPRRLIGACPCLVCASSGDRDPSTAPPSMAQQVQHPGCTQPLPCAVPAVSLAWGQVPGWAGGRAPARCRGSGVGSEGKRGTGPALFTPVTQPALLSCLHRAQTQQSPRAPQSCHSPLAWGPGDAPAQGCGMLHPHHQQHLQSPWGRM